MTFNQLEQICLLLWGQSWQSELSRHLNIDRRTVSGWKRQGVAKWVDDAINPIIEQRIIDVSEARSLHSVK